MDFTTLRPNMKNAVNKKMMEDELIRITTELNMAKPGIKPMPVPKLEFRPGILWDEWGELTCEEIRYRLREEGLKDTACRMKKEALRDAEDIFGRIAELGGPGEDTQRLRGEREKCCRDDERDGLIDGVFPQPKKTEDRNQEEDEKRKKAEDILKRYKIPLKRLGEYVGSERKIIIYPEAADSDEEMIMTLAHETFHAFHHHLAGKGWYGRRTSEKGRNKITTAEAMADFFAFMYCMDHGMTKTAHERVRFWGNFRYSSFPYVEALNFFSNGGKILRPAVSAEKLNVVFGLCVMGDSKKAYRKLTEKIEILDS